MMAGFGSEGKGSRSRQPREVVREEGETDQGREVREGVGVWRGVVKAAISEL